MRADPALRQAVLEREYARRSVLYVVLSTLLLGHLALTGRLPDMLRVASGVVLVAGTWLWHRARRRAPARGRKAAWAGWAVACLVATAGLVVTRNSLELNVVLPAALYGLATFGLGCALAADARRFDGYGAVRWMSAFLLVFVLLVLHQGLLETLGDGDGGRL